MNDRGVQAKHEARLGAVQALYQMEVTEIGDEAVILEFEEHRFGHSAEGVEVPQADRRHFERIVRGVIARQSEVDSEVNSVLKTGWALDRLDATLRAVLRAGAFELLACDDIPPRVVLNEYVEIAHAFFSGDEPGFINGVLDKIARQRRDMTPAQSE